MFLILILFVPVLILLVAIFLVFITVCFAVRPILLATCASLTVEAGGSMVAFLVVTLFVVSRGTIIWAAVCAWPIFATDIAEFCTAFTAISD